MDLENSKPEAAASTVITEDTQKNFDRHRETYEKLRADVAVKMQFLDENRVSICLRVCDFTGKIIHSFFFSLGKSDA